MTAYSGRISYGRVADAGVIAWRLKIDMPSAARAVGW
jgi:hypothetical protein